MVFASSMWAARLLLSYSSLCMSRFLPSFHVSPLLNKFCKSQLSPLATQYSDHPYSRNIRGKVDVMKWKQDWAKLVVPKFTSLQID